MVTVASNERIEFGDFQTPVSLAHLVCKRLRRLGVMPRSVFEPSCGDGVFLGEAAAAFPTVASLAGIDIQPARVRAARQRLQSIGSHSRVSVRKRDFFQEDWEAQLGPMEAPLLVIGNPPWVNNSTLSRLGSANVPKKSNRDGARGIEAATGKSNFDVSQWMIQRLVESIQSRSATLAMLCKTRVARAALSWSWNRGIRPSLAAIYSIDAMEHFGAAVDACLFVCRFPTTASSPMCCDIYASLEDGEPRERIGYEDGLLVREPRRFHRVRHLLGHCSRRWRSGIKHDCARVLELRFDGSSYHNGFGQRVDVESESLHPLLKGSRLARGVVEPDRWLLVPQTSTGQDLGELREHRPRALRYLESHGEKFDRRGSSIYRRRPRFAIFGVGAYSFTPWKVAVAGFAKSLAFHKLGPWQGRPVVLDDTSYFLSCQSEDEADQLLELLRHPAVTDFFACLVFWDMKRPITAEILQRLDLDRSGRGVTDASRQFLVG